MRRLVVSALALMCVAGGARADTMADCTQRTDLDKAVTACTMLVKDAAKDKDKLAVAYLNLGQAQKGKGDLRSALTNLGWALVYDPNNAGYWHERALVRTQLGQTLRAAADETLAIRYDPRKVDAWVNRGDLYRAMGALQKAISDETEALKLDPKSSAAYAARAYAQLRLGQLDKAKADADEAIKADGKSVRGYLTRGLANEKADKPKAVEDLKKVLELDAKNQQALDALKRIDG